MARNTTDSYWQARAEERLVASEQTGKAYYKQIEAAYSQALRNLEDSLQELYDAYYNRNTLSFDLNELNVKAASGTLERFRSLVTEAGLVLPAEYQGRLSRLEHLYAQAWFEAQKAGQAEYAQSSQLYSDVYQRAYYTSGQATIVSTGTSRALSTLDRRAVDQVLNTKFYGKNYSERIWANTNTFAKELKETLSAAIASGESPVKTARKLRERFDVRKYYAERLVRTETNYFHNQAELDSYSALGIDEYKILATLDARTSEVCQEMDGKTFKVSKAEVGVNYPPFHPNCRTTTIAPVDNLIQDRQGYQRGARDQYGNVRYVDADTTYPNYDPAGPRLEDEVVMEQIGVSKDYWDNEMYPHEKEFARGYLADGHQIRWIDRAARVDATTNRRLESNDFVDLDEGVEYELKSIENARYGPIKRAISSAAKSGYKKNFVVDLGRSSLTSKLRKQLGQYNQRNPHNKIERLKVWARGRSYTIDLQ